MVKCMPWHAAVSLFYLCQLKAWLEQQEHKILLSVGVSPFFHLAVVISCMPVVCLYAACLTFLFMNWEGSGRRLASWTC